MFIESKAKALSVQCTKCIGYCINL